MSETTNFKSGATGSGAAGSAPEARPSWLTLGRIVGVTAAAALVVGLIAGPIVNGGHTEGASTAGTTEHTMTVSGTGTMETSPNVGDVVLGIQVTRPTAKDARAAAATAMQAIVASIKKNGVPDKDIKTVHIGLSPVYEYRNSTATLTGYSFTNLVKATVRDLDKLPAVIDDGVTAGATQVQGISFRVDDPKPLQVQARDLAVADARSKADALAKAAGVSIRGVVSVSESSYTPSPIYYSAGSADMAKEASTPVQSGTTTIQVTVTVTYLIG